MQNRYKSIAFQGIPGAYSDLACRIAFPELRTIPCETFEETFGAVRENRADLAMIPVDNTLAGRVADVHHLLPNGGLYIIGEHFQQIRHCLLGLNDARIDGLTDVYSHVHALPQCRNFIRRMNLKSHVCSDTAKGAADINRWRNNSRAAIASELAADIYGLKILKKDIQDADDNHTRFLVLCRDNYVPLKKEGQNYVTTFVFDVKNIPAALYKALGGFATNNVQMVKLESYVDNHFNVARFYADVEGHISEKPLERALAELNFFAENLVMLGTYKAHPFRVFDH